MGERDWKKEQKKINMNGGYLLIGLMGVLSSILFYIHIYYFYNKMFFKKIRKDNKGQRGVMVPAGRLGDEEGKTGSEEQWEEAGGKEKQRM